MRWEGNSLESSLCDRGSDNDLEISFACMLEHCIIRLLTQALKLQARISVAVFTTDLRFLLSISCLHLGCPVLQ